VSTPTIAFEPARTRPKRGAFFFSEDDDLVWSAVASPRSGKESSDLHSRDDAGHPVERPPSRDRVQMRADDHGRQVPVGATRPETRVCRGSSFASRSQMAAS